MSDNLQQTEADNNQVTTILTVKTIVSNNLDNVVDSTSAKMDQLDNKIENKIDKDFDTLQNKVDSINTTAINHKIDNFITDVMNFASNSMGGFTSLAQKAVDGVILNSSVPEPLKTELVKDVNFGMSTVSVEVKKTVEDLEKRAEDILSDDLPVIEHRITDFLKGFLTKVKHAADNMIEHCESTSHKLGAKIKAFFHHHSQDDQYEDSHTPQANQDNINSPEQEGTLIYKNYGVYSNSSTPVDITGNVSGVLDSHGNFDLV